MLLMKTWEEEGEEGEGEGEGRREKNRGVGEVRLGSIGADLGA